jgi:hypothetical protein
MLNQGYNVTFLEYLLNWFVVFAIGLMLWFGAKIEGNKARYQDYKLRRNLKKMFRKTKIEDIEKWT